MSLAQEAYIAANDNKQKINKLEKDLNTLTQNMSDLISIVGYMIFIKSKLKYEKAIKELLELIPEIKE